MCAQVVLEQRVALLKAGAKAVLKAVGCIPITSPPPSMTQEVPTSATHTLESIHISPKPQPATTSVSGRPPLPPQQPQAGSKPDAGSQSERSPGQDPGSKPDPGSKSDLAGASPPLTSHYSTLLLHLGQLEARSRAVVAVYSTLMGKQSPVMADFRAATSRPSSAHSPSPPPLPTTTSTTSFGSTFLTEVAGVGGRPAVRASGLSGSKTTSSLLTKMPAVSVSTSSTQMQTLASLRLLSIDTQAADPGVSSSGDSEISAVGHANLHLAGSAGLQSVGVGRPRVSGSSSFGGQGMTFATLPQGGLDGGGERFSFAPVPHSVSGSSEGGDDDDEDGEDGEEDAMPLTREQIMSTRRL